MKKVFGIVFCMAVSGAAFAQQTVCSSTTGAAIISGNPANFVRTDVAVKCSNNVDARFNQTANGAAVTSSSIKGKHIFGGSTGGGSVGVQGVCASSTCTAAQLDAPLAILLAAAT
ncbi:MAG: hypothetical protein E6Q44_17365 [Flavobacteriales bacterium]|nr:MAG: hypothetical protein E6Q44_17365 [Flavobacteriales bacterium]